VSNSCVLAVGVGQAVGQGLMHAYDNARHLGVHLRALPPAGQPRYFFVIEKVIGIVEVDKIRAGLNPVIVGLGQDWLAIE
jgi:hypothetical protein